MAGLDVRDLVRQNGGQLSFIIHDFNQAAFAPKDLDVGRQRGFFFAANGRGGCPPERRGDRHLGSW